MQQCHKLYKVIRVPLIHAQFHQILREKSSLSCKIDNGFPVYQYVYVT